MKRNDAGFTLLEMLVALVVFGLVMAGIAQSFKFGLVAWQQGPARTTEPENLAAFDAALARMIQQAVPDSVAGNQDEIAFTTGLPAGSGLPPGLADVAIFLAPDARLVLRYRLHPPGIALDPLAAPVDKTLIPDVAALSLSYLMQQGAAPPVWSSGWSGDGLPLLVRLHIQLANGKSWPDLIAAPRNMGD